MSSMRSNQLSYAPICHGFFRNVDIIAHCFGKIKGFFKKNRKK
jgi:hypothetical protein